MAAAVVKERCKTRGAVMDVRHEGKDKREKMRVW